MAIRGPRLEFSVGAFLLLALASLLVLAVASTNQRFGMGGGDYVLKARFTQIGQLRAQAPVKVGGVTIGQVADIQLDPVKYDSIVTLALDNKFKDLPAACWARATSACSPVAIRKRSSPVTRSSSPNRRWT